MRQNTTKTQRPRLQHKHPLQLLRDAEMFDEILTQNHQESLPENSTNGADIFLKRILGKEMEEWPWLGLDTQERLPILMRSYWHYWFLIWRGSSVPCGLFGHYRKEAMTHKDQCTDTRWRLETSVFACVLFSAAYLMKLYCFIQQVQPFVTWMLEVPSVIGF